MNSTQTCDRCYKTLVSFTTSMFNTDTICMECKRKEKAHPLYAAAVQAESEACKHGNYNFPGIGKPSDL